MSRKRTLDDLTPDELIIGTQKLIDVYRSTLDGIRGDQLRKGTRTEIADIKRRLDILERQGRAHDIAMPDWAAIVTNEGPAILQ